MNDKAFVARRGFALSSRQCVFVFVMGMQKHWKVFAHRNKTLGDHLFGRAAYHHPADILCEADRWIFGDGADTTAEGIVEAMLPYIDAHVDAGGKLGSVTRHMLGLFSGRPGARIWRRVLSENAHRSGAGSALVRDALEQTMVQTALASQPDAV